MTDLGTFLITAAIFIPICLGCYAWGWYVRGKAGARTIYVERRYKGEAMTDQQREHFENAFAHVDKAFDEMGKVFDRG